MRFTYATAVLTTILVAALVVAGAATGEVDLRAKLQTSLSGAEEVPPGDPDGTGRATIRLNSERGFGRTCAHIVVENIERVFNAHIHNAPAGQNGPIVVDLTPTGDEADDGIWKVCILGGRPLVKKIIRNPTQYYVNVHTVDYRDGAIRGQLGD